MRGRGRRWRQRGCSRRVARMLRPALLLLLHHGPAHGYTLIERLEAFGLGDRSHSVVYRELRNMEEKGWVASSWDEEQTKGPPRRVYSLTELGDEVLNWWIQDLNETNEMIENILNAYAQHMEEGEGAHH